MLVTRNVALESKLLEDLDNATSVSHDLEVDPSAEIPDVL